MRFGHNHLALVLLALAAMLPVSAGADAPPLRPHQSEFFAKQVRPLLVENCYKCHSKEGEKIKGGFLLDSRDGMLKGGNTGVVVVPGDIEKSLLIKAVRYGDPDLQMPPKKQLSAEQVKVLEEWVRMGAPYPVTAQAATPLGAVEFSAAERAHWALQSVKRPQVPVVKNAEGVTNPIDAFIVMELEGRGIVASGEADRVTLIRRAAFDLHGLPPTPAEVEAFVNDRSPDAWERLIDRLLASPRYGERWGRHWLDLARYAESDGFKDDDPRPFIWRYRDYVIKSFNDDKPYDRFVKEQIAGDELWPDDPDAKVATGFNRHYADEWNARNLYQRRQEILNDVTDTVGAVFMGLTVGCARCHDHKYDPIRQVDYYRLQAFFANTAAADRMPLASAEQLAEYNRKLAVWEEKAKAIRDEIEAMEAPKREALVKEYFVKYPPEIQEMIRKPAEQRTPYERMMVNKARQYLDPESNDFVGRPSKMAGKFKAEEKLRWDELKKKLKGFDSLHPGELPMCSGMTDLGSDAPPTHLLNRGNYEAPKQEVPPGLLSVLDPAPAKVTLPKGINSTGRRTALAAILTDPANPLTARVMVNRIWQYHFGRGIVATPSDFGAKGEPPTHPALLDWLADEFVRGGWGMKRVHRLIMTSATYRQAPGWRDSAGRVDPDDKLLWHFPRQRHEAEVVRDSMLAVAGLLNTKMGGPSVFPELPPGAGNRGGMWRMSADAAERNRRSVYVFVRRNNRYPMLESFDMPDTLETCARRNSTTTPLQALTLLNNKLALEWAAALAGRVINEAPADLDGRVQAAYRLAYSRAAGDEELSAVREWAARHREIVAERAAAGEKMALLVGVEKGKEVDAAEGAVLVDLCHMLMNANEFLYRN